MVEANTLDSGVLLNDGRGRFRFVPLPRLARIAPPSTRSFRCRWRPEPGPVLAQNTSVQRERAVAGGRPALRGLGTDVRAGVAQPQRLGGRGRRPERGERGPRRGRVGGSGGGDQTRAAPGFPESSGAGTKPWDGRQMSCRKKRKKAKKGLFRSVSFFSASAIRRQRPAPISMDFGAWPDHAPAEEVLCVRRCRNSSSAC
jgi:hypothetical protein